VNLQGGVQMRRCVVRGGGWAHQTSSRSFFVELNFISGFGFNSVKKASLESYKTECTGIDGLSGVGGGLSSEVVEILVWS
jgi:hypothetical protein